MSKRNKIILAGLLIVSAITIGVLEGLGYDLISQHYERFIPGVLFGAGFSLIIISLFNKNDRIEENQ
ncbi:hypothetical protein DWB61_15035 [Ancylomarina euxinus]|uniref:Uncharacterized protein n=1 Tax=Ancylomarina euxinus TaxID=2283627 RepID=A0A425XXS5_9BACT|nr:hypothetical protein [Ancylomarina euxinus]MCZ4696031.1 hypothetical protein [Ancylomarina euxinus]MUP13970.1 hypothetical protein [Ancylomarina euxinus]RRG19524.1 hypothetical protein DWB61_15035 [Ancylomarina euxinus]